MTSHAWKVWAAWMLGIILGAWWGVCKGTIPFVAAMLIGVFVVGANLMHD